MTKSTVGLEIDFYPDQLLGWQGGRDFARTLFDALQAGAHSDDRIRIVTARYRSRLRRLLGGLRRLSKGDANDFNPALVLRPPGSDIRELLTSDRGVEVIRWRAPTRRRPAVAVGPAMYLDELLPATAVVGYIPDLQHKALPHLFSTEELAKRDAVFQDLLDRAPVVIVNSRDTLADIQRHYRARPGQVVALPMCPAPEPDWFGPSEPVQRKYSIEQRYFISSNQFWTHKNHRLVLEAIDQLRSEGEEVLVVFTGDTHDYRDPEHFGRLQQFIAERGITDNVRILGLIPKLDQVALIRGALAMIQPTLFEGGPGGGAAYDALALGCPLLVSDIAINHEIPDPSVLFFDPHSASDLVAQMRTAARSREARQEAATLIAAGRERRAECGRALRAAFQCAAQSQRDQTDA